MALLRELSERKQASVPVHQVSGGLPRMGWFWPPGDSPNSDRDCEKSSKTVVVIGYRFELVMV